jgi:hypothetical protein
MHQLVFEGANTVSNIVMKQDFHSGCRPHRPRTSAAACVSRAGEFTLLSPAANRPLAAPSVPLAAGRHGENYRKYFPRRLF